MKNPRIENNRYLRKVNHYCRRSASGSATTPWPKSSARIQFCLRHRTSSKPHSASMVAAANLITSGTQRTRLGRHSVAGQYYHLITCTADRRPVFANLYAGRMVVASLQRIQCESIATTLAFVVMPDHVHWLMQLGERKSLPVCVGSMKSFAARQIARCEPGWRSIWQRGYVDRAIRREEELVRVARYIVANPLRAGIVDDIGEYALWDSVWMDNQR